MAKIKITKHFSLDGADGQYSFTVLLKATELSGSISKDGQTTDLPKGVTDALGIKLNASLYLLKDYIEKNLE